MHDTLVIGAGQAGLATAHHLTRTGVTPLVLEAGQEATGAWPRFYDSLILFSPARHSQLPGVAFERDPDGYPSRDDVVAYLRRYANHLDADIRTSTTVTRVTWQNGTFDVATSTGELFTARHVISATGGFGRPHRPQLPGLDSFTGTVLHSADYHNPAQLPGTRLLVVGAGNSAVQIAVELAAHAEVTLTSRRPVRWVKQRPGGRDIHDWLAWTRLQHHPASRVLRPQGIGVLDDGTYRQAIDGGQPEWRPMFELIDGDKVTWADGTIERVDALILATGFRPQTGHLVALAGPNGDSAIDSAGLPRHRYGVSSTVPRLGFVGLEWQRGFASATLRGVGPDAAYVLPRVRAKSK
ncbi:flavin-containing monooxygenase [Micromonospora zhanjiangensis]|uniref:Flavin-containing monooxygenase n=1 Tax=Micromonospora zhanjiangensis TaxID=1522057 RepID=A0ABV8KW60_9ACTN